MQSVKTAAMVAMLGLVGWGVYVALHRKPQSDGTATNATAPKGDASTTGVAKSSSMTPDKDPGRFAAQPQRLNTQPDTTPPAGSPMLGAAGGSPSGASPPLGRDNPFPLGGSPSPAPPASGALLASGSPAPMNGATNPISPPSANTPAGAARSPVFGEVWRTAQQKLQAGQVSDAHLALSMIYDYPQLTGAEAKQVRDLLDQLAGTVVFSTQHYLEPAYVVKPGERLVDIAARYEVPPELLAKINGLDRQSVLRPGDTLKVVKGPFEAAVSLDRHEMIIKVQGRYAGRFEIGVGRDVALAEGPYAVKEKTPNPRYSLPGQPELDARDPRNPLGTRWIGLGGLVGIHGTNDPNTVGRDNVPGCISLRPTDVEDLYDILTIGSKVVVRR